MTGRRRRLWIGLVAVLALPCQVVQAQSAPDKATRDRALMSLVQIRAVGCGDGDRAGSGFAFRSPGQIVTAHHVVGGCHDVRVAYESVPDNGQRVFPATVVRVFAAGDLALLEVAGPPAVPVLDLAASSPDQDAGFAGLGYQNSQPTASDVSVEFASGPSLLKDILPYGTAEELRQNGSAIDIDSSVLRFKSHLQPGMSGGPIVDAGGMVIGIVAGGLKAGAAPASWGWPADWVERLLASSEAVDEEVRIASSYYTLSDMEREAAALETGRRITCGELDLDYRGARPFAEIAPGADDQQRLQFILQMSTLPQAVIDRLMFDLWVDGESGATAVTPAGHPIQATGNVCMIVSPTGPFRQVIWGAQGAFDQFQVQQAAVAFEQSVMAPLVPYPFGFQPDTVLSTMAPQLRENGLVFIRKAFSHPKAPWAPGMPPPPAAHTFETLIAKSGVFLGVGTLNDDLSPMIQYCLQLGGQPPECAGVMQHFEEWTHFILATQLSTFPST